MSVRDHFDLIFAWVEVSCWFALVEGGAWCFQHHWLKRQSFLHWLPLCLCQNSVDCPRVGLLWTCPPAHCPRGSASTDRPMWPQSQGPWSESGRPWWDSSNFDLFTIYFGFSSSFFSPCVLESCWYFYWNCLKSIDAFEENWHLNNFQLLNMMVYLST